MFALSNFPLNFFLIFYICLGICHFECSSFPCVDPNSYLVSFYCYLMKFFLLPWMVSDKKSDFCSPVGQVYFLLLPWLLLRLLFITCFQQFDYYMLWHDFFCLGLNLDLWVYSFHHIWIMSSHFFVQIFFLALPSSWESNCTHIRQLGIVP